MIKPLALHFNIKTIGAHFIVLLNTWAIFVQNNLVKCYIKLPKFARANINSGS